MTRDRKIMDLCDFIIGDNFAKQRIRFCFVLFYVSFVCVCLLSFWEDLCFCFVFKVIRVLEYYKYSDFYARKHVMASLEKSIYRYVNCCTIICKSKINGESEE